MARLLPKIDDTGRTARAALVEHLRADAARRTYVDPLRSLLLRRLEAGEAVVVAVWLYPVLHRFGLRGRVRIEADGTASPIE